MFGFHVQGAMAVWCLACVPNRQSDSLLRALGHPNIALQPSRMPWLLPMSLAWNWRLPSKHWLRNWSADQLRLDGHPDRSWLVIACWTQLDSIKFWFLGIFGWSWRRWQDHENWNWKTPAKLKLKSSLLNKLNGTWIVVVEQKEKKASSLSEELWVMCGTITLGCNAISMCYFRSCCHDSCCVSRYSAGDRSTGPISKFNSCPHACVD